MDNTQKIIDAAMEFGASAAIGGLDRDYASELITKALEGKIIVGAEELKHVLEFTTPFCSQEIKQHLLSTIKDES